MLKINVSDIIAILTIASRFLSIFSAFIPGKAKKQSGISVGKIYLFWQPATVSDATAVKIIYIETATIALQIINVIKEDTLTAIASLTLSALSTKATIAIITIVNTVN